VICYICERPAVGMCGVCDRFYCHVHAGRPGASQKGSCKVHAIGIEHDEHSKEAEELVEEILAGFGTTRWGGEALGEKAVLSQDQATRLLDSLIFILADSPNRDARMQVANALGALARMYPLVHQQSPLNAPAGRAVFRLVSALGDEDYWVRFAAADTLLRAECPEGISPIVRLWRARGIDAFPSNAIEDLEEWAASDDNINTLLQSVVNGLGMNGLWDTRRDE
jgi:hypothetical protein